MTKTTTKPVFPNTYFVVTLDYNRYAFDSIDKAARFVDCVSLGTKISNDYNADKRDDRAEVFYKDRVRTIAVIEAVNAVINEERTPDPKEDQEAA